MKKSIWERSGKSLFSSVVGGLGQQLSSDRLSGLKGGTEA